MKQRIRWFILYAVGFIAGYLLLDDRQIYISREGGRGVNFLLVAAWAIAIYVTFRFTLRHRKERIVVLGIILLFILLGAMALPRLYLNDLCSSPPDVWICIIYIDGFEQEPTPSPPIRWDEQQAFLLREPMYVGSPVHYCRACPAPTTLFRRLPYPLLGYDTIAVFPPQRT